MESGLSDSYFYIRKTIDLRSYSSALTGFPFQVITIVCCLTMAIAPNYLRRRQPSPEAYQTHSCTLIFHTAPTIHLTHSLLQPISISNGWTWFIRNSCSKHVPTVGRPLRLFWQWLLRYFHLQYVRCQWHSCWLWKVGTRYLWLLRHCMTWWTAFIYPCHSYVPLSPFTFWTKTLITHLFSNRLWQPTIPFPHLRLRFYPHPILLSTSLSPSGSLQNCFTKSFILITDILVLVLRPPPVSQINFFFVFCPHPYFFCIRSIFHLYT